VLVAQDSLTVVSRQVVSACAERVVKEVERFHAANPLAEAISKEDLRMRCAAGLSVEIFRAAIEEAASAGKIAVSGDLLKRAGREIRLQPGEARAKEQIEREFARCGLSAPDVATVLAALQMDRAQAQKIFQILVRERVLLKISNDIVLHRNAVDRARALVADYKRTHGERLTVGDFKDLAGITRKYAIPLLEYFDRNGVTRRVGDYRVIL
jgi:selenocysteine-specific elongation factor